MLDAIGYDKSIQQQSIPDYSLPGDIYGVSERKKIVGSILGEGDEFIASWDKYLIEQYGSAISAKLSDPYTTINERERIIQQLSAAQRNGVPFNRDLLEKSLRGEVPLSLGANSRVSRDTISKLIADHHQLQNDLDTDPAGTALKRIGITSTNPAQRARDIVSWQISQNSPRLEVLTNDERSQIIDTVKKEQNINNFVRLVHNIETTYGDYANVVMEQLFTKDGLSPHLKLAYLAATQGSPQFADIWFQATLSLDEDISNNLAKKDSDGVTKANIETAVIDDAHKFASAVSGGLYKSLGYEGDYVDIYTKAVAIIFATNSDTPQESNFSISSAKTAMRRMVQQSFKIVSSDRVRGAWTRDQITDNGFPLVPSWIEYQAENMTPSRLKDAVETAVKNSGGRLLHGSVYKGTLRDRDLDDIMYSTIVQRGHYANASSGDGFIVVVEYEERAQGVLMQLVNGQEVPVVLPFSFLNTRDGIPEYDEVYDLSGFNPWHP